MSPGAPAIARRWLAVGAALAFAGCASLFVSAPGRLYRLTPPHDFPPGLAHSAAQLAIDLPQAPAGIDNSRIALSRGPLTLDYYADAEWTDRVPDLIQNLLIDAFENSAALTAVDQNSGGLREDFLLRTEIRHFEAVYGAEGALPQVWVEIMARLVAMPRRTLVAQARFEQRVAATANAVPAAVAAFDSASAAVLREIVLWTVANTALSPSRRRVR
jgi:cholesterol transport system auxiliary component